MKILLEDEAIERASYVFFGLVSLAIGITFVIFCVVVGNDHSVSTEIFLSRGFIGGVGVLFGTLLIITGFKKK
jgi:uncharacterized membrane protein